MGQSEETGQAVRVVVFTTGADGVAVGGATAVRVPPGERLEVGREADVIIADDPEDLAVSRVALSLTCRPDGAVDLEVGNRNGVVVHPWGGRSRYLAAGPGAQPLWGRTGIRVVGGGTGSPDGDTGPQVHWVLVEGDAGAAVRHASVDPRMTVLNPRPDPLTAAQRDAVELVFAEHLAWPPLAAPATLTIDAAARRLSISPAAVNQRLEGVRKKAYALGMAQQYGVVDPEYVHALAAHGYLSAPEDEVPAEDLPLFD